MDPPAPAPDAGFLKKKLLMERCVISRFAGRGSARRSCATSTEKPRVPKGCQHQTGEN